VLRWSERRWLGWIYAARRLTRRVPCRGVALVVQRGRSSQLFYNRLLGSYRDPSSCAVIVRGASSICCRPRQRVCPADSPRRSVSAQVLLSQLSFVNTETVIITYSSAFSSICNSPSDRYRRRLAPMSRPVVRHTYSTFVQGSTSSGSTSSVCSGPRIGKKANRRAS